MLRNAKIIAFLATTNAKRCRKFYESVLGPPLVSDDKFALAFDCKGTQLRIQKVEKFSAVPVHIARLACAEYSKPSGQTDESRRDV